MFLRRAFNSYILVGVGAVLAMLFSYVTVTGYTLEVLGSFSTFFAFALICTSLIKLGVSNLILKEAGRDSWSSNEIFWYGQLLLLKNLVVVGGPLLLAAYFFELDDSVILFATVILMVYFDFSVIICRAFSSPNLATFFESCIRPGILLLLLGFDLYYRLDIILILIVPLSYLISLALIIIKVVSMSKADTNPISVVRARLFVTSFSSTNLSLGLVNIASVSFQNIFILVSETVAGLAAAGLIKIAFQFGSLINLSSVAVNNLFSSDISRLFHSYNIPQLIIIIGQCRRFMVSVGVGTYLCIMLSIEYIASTFELDSQNYYLLLVICFGFLAQSLVGPCGNILNMVSKQRVNLYLFVFVDLVALLIVPLGNFLSFSVTTLSFIFALCLFCVSLFQRFFLLAYLKEQKF